MNKNKYFLLLILISFSIFLSGCWDKKEVTDIAIVAAIAIDKNEEGRYLGTYQFFIPGNIANSLQGGGGGQSPPVSVYSATGDTFLEISGKISEKISREPYYSHANLLIFSEELAREEGIASFLDAFDRGNQFRTTTRIIIARDTLASNMLKILTTIENVPAEKIMKNIISTQEHWGESVDVNLSDVINQLITEGIDPLISGFTVKGNPEEGKKQENLQETNQSTIIEADGLAIFKNGKLIDWLSSESARGAVWTLNKIKNTTMAVDWEQKKQVISFQVVRQKTRINVDNRNGKPHITVNVRAEGEISEIKTPIDLKDPDILNDMENVIEKEIKKEIEKAIHQGQKHKADIFGFGDTIHRTDLKLWKTVRKDWESVIFPNLDVEVKVDTFIRGTELRNNSFLSEIK
ncbi:Ger(x)C family spore germination protein [Terribacillus sp. JSM ZJ617]|uniref:Ger(x)C family spore germination protein n=1 Tax=Terribacillus sp. JSM ZJ617 TaxID=3342119 RepID=UPI0035A81BB3